MHVELLQSLLPSVGRSRGGNCRQDMTRYPNEPGASLITGLAMHSIQSVGISRSKTIVFVHPPIFS